MSDEPNEIGDEPWFNHCWAESETGEWCELAEGHDGPHEFPASLEENGQP